MDKEAVVAASGWVEAATVRGERAVVAVVAVEATAQGRGVVIAVESTAARMVERVEVKWVAVVAMAVRMAPVGWVAAAKAKGEHEGAAVEAAAAGLAEGMEDKVATGETMAVEAKEAERAAAVLVVAMAEGAKEAERAAVIGVGGFEAAAGEVAVRMVRVGTLVVAVELVVAAAAILVVAVRAAAPEAHVRSCSYPRGTGYTAPRPAPYCASQERI